MTVMHVNSRTAFPNSRQQYPRSPSPVYPEPDIRGLEGAEHLAGFLGWFSIGLGLTSLLAPRGVARMIGARGDSTDRSILRLVGLQELACGIGILSNSRPTGWVWARVAGDAAHLTLLGRRDGLRAARAATDGGHHRGHRRASPRSTLYNALQLTRTPNPTVRESWTGPVEVHQSITINRPAEELYRFWRDFRNLPRFMTPPGVRPGRRRSAGRTGRRRARPG